MGHLGSLVWFPCGHCGLKVVFLGRSGDLWKSTHFYSNDSVLFGRRSSFQIIRGLLLWFPCGRSWSLQKL